MKVKLFIIPLMFLMMFSLVFATNTYTHMGGNGIGEFDNGLQIYDGSFYFSTMTNILSSTAPTLSSQVVTKPRGSPLTAKLKPNLEQSIVIFDNDRIKVYNRSNGLTLENAYILDSDPSMIYTAPYIYDINGDGRDDIIIANWQQASTTPHKAWILDMNETGQFVPIKIFNWSTGGQSPRDVTLSCKDVNDCAVILVGATTQLQVNSFSSSGFVAQSGNLGTAGGVDVMCFPIDPVFPAVNIDPQIDGDIEYVISGIQEGDPHIFIVNVNSSGNAILKRNIAVNNVPSETFRAEFNNEACTLGRTGRAISSPLVANLNGVFGDGLEIVMGATLDGFTNWDTVILDSTGGFIQAGSNGAFSSDSAGSIMMNGAIGSFISDGSSGQDYCMGGLNPTASNNRTLVIACGSLQSTDVYGIFDGGDQCETTYRVAYNISSATQFRNQSSNRNMIAIISNLSETNNRGEKKTQLLTTFGLLDMNHCDNAEQDVLNVPYNFPFTWAVVIPGDVDNSGKSDLIAMNQNNIYYFDDNFVNTNAQLSAYSFNPCNNLTWAVNGTATAQFTIIDADSDLISANFSAYYGDSNQQDTFWTYNVSSGTVFSYDFQANKTGNNNIMRVNYMDNKHSLPSHTDFLFTVANSGIVKNDITCGATVITNATTVITTTATFPDGSSTNNSISSIITAGTTLTGLSTTIMWFTFMIVFIFAVLFSDTIFGGVAVLSGGIKGIIIIFGEILLLIIGTFLGYISAVLIVVLVILCVVIGGVFVFGKFFGTHSGG